MPITVPDAGPVATPVSAVCQGLESESVSTVSTAVVSSFGQQSVSDIQSLHFTKSDQVCRSTLPSVTNPVPGIQSDKTTG